MEDRNLGIVIIAIAKMTNSDLLLAISVEISDSEIMNVVAVRETWLGRQAQRVEFLSNDVGAYNSKCY